MTDKAPPATLEPLKFQVADSERGVRLDRFLVAQLPHVSRSRIQQTLESGKVWIEGLQRDSHLKSSHHLHGGETVCVELEAPPPLRGFPESIPLEILHEDDCLVAINNPAGMAVHLGAGVRSGTLVNALLHRFQSLSSVGGEARPGIVHRLDRNTSGIVLIAKDDQTHRNLAAQFSSRTVHKQYIALVHGRISPDHGTISTPISRDLVRRTRMTTRRRDGRSALTRYQLMECFRGFSLLSVEISTGRMHQIRVHLSSIGHPVAGDTLYGAPSRISASLLKNPSQIASQTESETFSTLPRQFLHATRIRFQHPKTGQPVELHSPLPSDLAEFLSALVP